MYKRCVLLLGVLVIAGCGGELSEEKAKPIEELVSTITPAPTATYTVDEGEAITSAEEISGIWFSLKSKNYTLFREDGFYAASADREGLNTGQAFQGQYWFENEVLYIQYENVEDANGEPQPVVVNSFTVVQFPDNTIRFFAVEAEHEPLSNWVAGDSGVVVYFHRVD